jgi:competence protein ComEC
MLGLGALRGSVFGFVPVGLGIGIGVWFGLTEEPGLGAYASVALCLGVAVLLHRLVEPLQPLAVFAACLLGGFLACGLRVQMVAAPILREDFYGAVTGRIVEVDRSQAGALRITLDRVWLEEVPPDMTPAHVRLSLQGDQRWLDAVPGSVVMATAFLSPPQGPVEPGAFDFRRMAFFEGLGAVGYTRHPVLLWEEPAPGEERVGRLRAFLSAAIRAEIAGDAGAFAAGVLTGDRSGLSRDAVEALRDSSLAHLLAISGMNMAFLIAFVFALLRFGLALVPPVALRLDSKKVAAVVSLGVAWFYLLLSGANVATERAFIMVAVMLVAVLLDRRAITLRSVAIAAMILLLWQPEALLSPGFQMSFAATVALIVGFAAMTDRMEPGRWPRWGQFGVALVLSSVLGGVATAPYAAAHFNRFTDYGLLANLLTGQVMGMVVMPAGAMAAVMAPFGLAGLPLWVMEQGCRWILYVAYQVAALEGAVTAIPAPPPAVLPMLTLGLCWMVLWPGWLRWGGGVAVLAALVIWAQAARPVVLIGAGGVVGVMGPEGRAISAPRGAGFMVANWLENDGDLSGQEVASRRPGFTDGEGGRVFAFAGRTGLLVSKGDPVPASACQRHALVVVQDMAAEDGHCLVVDTGLLEQSGTIAIMEAVSGARLQATQSDQRLWSSATGGARLSLPPSALPGQ